MTYHFPKKILVSRISLTRGHFIRLNENLTMKGRNHGWKVEETKAWVPTPGRSRPPPAPITQPSQVKMTVLRQSPSKNRLRRRGAKAGLVFGCGRWSPPPAVRVRAYHPENFWKLRC